MKTLLLSFPFAFSLLATQAAYSAVGDTRQKESKHSVVERGANHRVWQRVTLETNAVGKVRARTNSYTELKTGMHFKDGNGKWVDSEATIEITPTGASASKGAHTVNFAANINTIGAIDLTMPDGKRMRSHVLGLSYFDTATGQSAMIAEIKDSVGLLAPPNQIFYPDAFTEVKADIGYTYSAHGFEQDIILRAQLPSPEEYGLNPETTQLEVLTEFIESPAPTKSVERLKNGAIDETLNFGAMQIGVGKAFSLGETNGSSEATSVLKRWTQMEGRDFLIEALPYVTIEGKLAELPKEEAKAPEKGAKTARAAATKIRKLPVRREARLEKERIEVASIAETPGFLIDYLITLSGGASYTNYTFKGDTTYYVSGTVNLYGTTTLEGGTVIKYSTSGYIRSKNGMFDCKTDFYRPAVFTSKNDNSAGETISGSTGFPAAYEYLACFSFEGGTSVLSNVRFSYASWPCSFQSGSSGGELNNAQFVNCAIPINSEGKAIRLRNVLITKSQVPLRGNGAYKISAENITIDNADTQLSGPGSGSIFFTNSIVTAFTNLGNATIITNNSLVSATSVPNLFQKVGAASYYLATNSVYRNAGTTNINAKLLADLREKTTYPPIVLTNDFVVDTTLSPYAQRDTDIPDLGYHYDPLDYALANLTISNATLILTNGVALGIYLRESDFGSLFVENGGVLVSRGTPTQPNRLVWYNTVQEQSVTNWIYLDGLLEMLSYKTYGGSGGLDCKFTHFARLAGPGAHIGAGDAGWEGSFTMENCEFYNSVNYFWSASVMTGGGLSSDVKNCLFDRCQITLMGREDDLAAFIFSNNLLYNGAISLNAPSGSQSIALFVDNFFYTNSIYQSSNLPVVHSYNAYLTNCNRLTNNGTGDVILTNFVFQTNSFGCYYQPTNSPLLGVGSRNATNAGLYHFTVTTNQIKETNSTVDIGFHYVALDGLYQPIDTDSDGLADYAEDANGNGIYDSADFSNWQDSDTDDDWVDDYTEWLQGRSARVGAITSNSADLHIFTPLK